MARNLYLCGLITIVNKMICSCKNAMQRANGLLPKIAASIQTRDFDDSLVILKQLETNLC